MNDFSDEMIAEMGLSNIRRKRCYGLSNEIIIADYIYEKMNVIVARYIIVYCNCEEFTEVLCQNSVFYQEIVHECFFECYDTDLCWNLYQICVMNDVEYRSLSKGKMLEYEADTNYTRKLLIPLEEMNIAIPVGKIRNEYRIKMEDLISPKDEWSRQLKDAKLEFCGEEYNEKILMKYLETGEYEKSEKEKKKRYKRYNIDNILDISIPYNFRKNCFRKQENLEFGKTNIFMGKNGSGKTSVLEGIELVVTGSVRKAMGVYKSYDDVTAISCRINEGQKIVKPRSSEEMLRRINSWYHKQDADEQTLNSEFHLYNYFTAVDTFILSYLGDKRNLNRQFFQVLFGEENLNFYENIEKYLESVSYLERIEKERLDKAAEEISLYQSKKWEINFYSKIKKYPVKFDQSWAISEIDQKIKECLRICRKIEDLDTKVSSVSLIQDEKEVMKHREEIRKIEKEIKYCDDELSNSKRNLIQLQGNRTSKKDSNLPALEMKIKNYSRTIEEFQSTRDLKMNILQLKKNLLFKCEESLSRMKQINLLYDKANEIIDMSLVDFKVSDINQICKEINELLNQEQWSLDREENNLHIANYQKSNELLIKIKYIKKNLFSMRKPEYYLEKYAGNNIKKISDLFLLLQSPKEYDGLAFNEGKELVGVRNEEKIPLHMMSSGQRVAAVMALFFCVHLSSDSVPNIVLLDEPISHIDELNILALFDLLRELVIQYDKQLFFTTSTKEVGKLFERKFSFLGENYKNFHFERKGNTETKITIGSASNCVSMRSINQQETL